MLAIKCGKFFPLFIRCFSFNHRQLLSTNGSEALWSVQKTLHSENLDLSAESTESRTNIKHDYLLSYDRASILKNFFKRFVKNQSANARRIRIQDQLCSEEISLLLNRGFPSIHSLKNFEEFDKHGNMIFMMDQLYSHYQTIVKNEEKENKTLLIRYDINRFIKWYLFAGQLKKARKIFQQHFRRDVVESEIPPHDVQTLLAYFQLYLGSYTRFWNSKFKWGRKSDNSERLTYVTLEESKLHMMINKLGNNKQWQRLYNTELHANVILALGYYNNLPFLGKYIKDTWDIGIDENSDRAANINSISSQSYPDSKILSAVVTSYAHCRNLKDGLILIAKFWNSYPELHLGIKFWRNIFSWSYLYFDKKTDPEGTVQQYCWNAMKSWYNGRGEPVPYDYSIMKTRLDILKAIGNCREVISAVESCLSQLFIKDNVNPKDRRLTTSYLMYIIRRLCALGEYNACVKFIHEWNFDLEHSAQLYDYYRSRWHTEELIAKKPEVEDENDFSFTGDNLW